MLKKFVFTLVAVLGISTAAFAGSSYAHDANVLPQPAQTTLSNFFNSEVTVVKTDKELGRISEYEVVLSDGTEISFDSKGNWENVEVGTSEKVPAAFIPRKVAAYLKENYADQSVIGIEKDRHNIEVTLSNGVELKFDNHGKFIKID